MVIRFYPALTENKLLITKELLDESRGRKKWGPQNEGISVDMYENKGQKKWARRLL
jgi:hypothetical protein